MKYNTLTRAVMAFALLLTFAFVSCSESSDESTNTEQEPIVPTIEISNIVAAAESVSFTLTPTDAVMYQYSVAPSGDETDYTKVASSKETAISLKNLTQGVEYEISAMAYSVDNTTSEVVTATFTTEETVTYDQTSIALKFTATWCTVCPYMTEAMDAVLEADPTSMVVVAVHYESTAAYADLESEGGNTLIDEYSISSLPTTYIDYRETVTYDQSAIEGVIRSSNEDYPTTSDLAITSSVEDGVAKITVSSKYGATARYKIGVVITENNIYRSSTDGSDDGYYHHVAREFLTNPLGDSLGKLVLGDTQTNDYECTLDSSWDVDNLEVVAFILKEEGTNRYYGNNAASTSINGSVDFK